MIILTLLDNVLWGLAFKSQICIDLFVWYIQISMYHIVIQLRVVVPLADMTVGLLCFTLVLHGIMSVYLTCSKLSVLTASAVWFFDYSNCMASGIDRYFHMPYFGG